MRPLLRLLGLCASLSFCHGMLAAQEAPPESISFNRDVRPILSDHCFACHGLDENKREADLRFDTADGAMADLGGYAAIVPGKLNDSEAWQRIISDDSSEVMPPPEFHKPLSDAQKEILAIWIKAGAPYQQHWSFVPPTKTEVPSADVANPIDAFLQEAILEQGLEPNPVADRATLIRRLSLDLTGLPPTAEEVTQFLSNDSENAYEHLIDELQSRVTYGEHMARYWLDLARYADTHGLHLDNERSIWPYRDWVVRAINQNLAFDEFTRWQLAGDLLPEPTQDQLIASGFNRCNVTTSEGGSINDEWIFRYAVDRTATAVEVWMGLTAGCAVCHDHKFDPLTAKEFYSMYAFFHSAADPAMDGNIKDTPPILKLIPEEEQVRAAELKKQIATIDQDLDAELAAAEYDDPALRQPPAAPELIDELWFEDGFPAGAKVEHSGGPPLQLVGKDEGLVFQGERALTRTSDNQISQDFFSSGASLIVPQNGKFFVHCYLDPDNPPEAIMVQFNTGSWKNRGVWGAQEKISFGKPGTTEKVHLGELPKTGEWIRLEMDAKQLGLGTGTKVQGYAFTQFGGTVTWDHFGVTGRIDKANDPTWSWSKWLAQDYAQIRKALPDALRRQLQGRTPERWTDEESRQVKQIWTREIYRGAQTTVAKFQSRKAPLESQIQKIEDSSPVTFVMAELPKPRKSFVMLRGAYDNPGEQVTRDVPAFLPSLTEREDGQDFSRLDLANWLLDRNHPLTARVTVNRVWQQFFGRGLVETSSDFGSQGSPPSHPELLDWLAVQFIEDGWDMKKLVKRIVTSHAYRQSSQIPPEQLAKDPENRWLARAPRLRLDAEVLRDQALYLSQLLVPTVGGPGVKPYQPDNIWEPVGFGNSNTRYYKRGDGDDLYRRSLYTFLKRTAPPPFMSTFDAPNREQSCSLRQRSNTPMQALQLMNDIQHVEAARALGYRILREGGDTIEDRVQWAWSVVTARKPTADEHSIALSVLKTQLQDFGANLDRAKQLVAYGESEVGAEEDPAELAAYTMLANLLLNLDEVVSKN